ncbi:TonB-dependent receptor domain-containing protein [Erythrobacter sp. NE805]|uniref:TonB-dependent receptor n=1 Tax=Erythrobacter sp. NE805 TaxID=3389875 RepID=UPI00396B3CFD
MKLNYLLAASIVSLAATTTIATPAFAQQITTTVQGSVSDENGQPVAGATVTVTDTRTGTSRTLATGADGTFVATGLVTGGPYTVEANAGGFEGQSIEGVYTSLQGATRLDFSLQSGSGAIVVTGARVKVTQLAVGPGTSFTGEVLTAAPSFNRDIRDVIKIDPRVSLDREDSTTGGNGQDRISCLGGLDRGNAFTLDGIPQVDVYGLNDAPFASRSSSPIPYDAIREIQVQFAPFDVEFGGFTGCAINAVTKSGSNAFHGGGFFEYSDNGLRGDNVNGLPVAAIEPEKRWGAYLGGPIIKDRLFFFGAYEHQEAGQSQDDGPSGAGYTNPIASIPVAAFNEISTVLKDVYGIDTGPLVFSRPFENDRYFARLDFQINDRHRLEATYQQVDETTVLTDDFSTTPANARITGLNTYRNSGSNSKFYSGRLYSNWSDTFSTEVRVARSDVVDNQGPVGGGEAQDANPIPRIIVGIDTGNDGVAPFGSVLAGPGFSRSANDLRYRVDQYRFVAKLDAGNHKLKLGAELNDLDLENLFIQNATGTLYFRNVNDLREGIIFSVPNGSTNPTTTQLVQGQTIGIHGNFSATGDPRSATAFVKRKIYTVFAQDDWEISDRLSAILGLRYDWYDGNAPASNPLFLNRYGFSNTTGFSALGGVLQPRVALTYEADDFAFFARPVLRGGVGIFGGGDPGVWFGNAFQNNGITFAEGTYQSANCPGGATSKSVDVVTNGKFTGVPSCFVQDGVSQAARGLGDAQSINPNIKPPTVLRANFGFSSELNFADSGFFSGWNLNIDYIYSRYRNPLGLVDLSQTPDIRLGLNGFTRDGRPIYRSLDPLQPGCGARLVSFDPVPVYSGLTAANAAACFSTQRDDELMLTNDDGYDSQVASFVLSKTFDGGVLTENGSTFFSFGLAYTDSNDRRNQYSSTAGSVYDGNAAFDRQQPDVSRGFYNSKLNITAQANFREEFFDNLSTRLGMTFVARSGRPYSLTFTGRYFNDINTTAFDSSLIYLPTGVNDPNVAPTSNMTAVQALTDFANNLDCAKGYIGRSIERNTCSLPWYLDMDLSFSQEIPGPGRVFGLTQDKIRLFATVDNFFNLLDSSWNLQKRRNFTGWTDLAEISGVDAQGRYIFTNANAITPNAQGVSDFDRDEFINVTGSVWRIKVGVSYEF